MMLNVTEAERGAWRVLRISGEMDLVSSPEVRQCVHDAVAAGCHDVVLDLSDVVFCDSSGVGVLIAARRLMRSCQGRLRLILPGGGEVGGMSGQGGAAHVNKVLGALGVRRLFEVYADVYDATEDDAQPISA
ncbi:STAS domain-containing protein [Streptomyces sp. NPDC059398]|uniref:STAS domain-containing protein n=1 Tax=Streptomyces sp. NPDC059398 TaxID=3346820 RepID=UPI00367ECC7B